MSPLKTILEAICHRFLNRTVFPFSLWKVFVQSLEIFKGMQFVPDDANMVIKPWSRASDNKLCPYAMLWRHWNLSGYTPCKRTETL